MTTAARLPDPNTLNNLQLTEQACALCGARLYRDRLLGTVIYRDHYGRKVTAELWACAPQVQGAPAMIQVCRECDDEVDDAVPVALEHAASVGGRVVYLCAVCRFVMRVVPLSEHPPGSLGYVRYEEEAAF